MKKPRITHLEGKKISGETLQKMESLIIDNTSVKCRDKSGNETDLKTELIAHGYQRPNKFKYLNVLTSSGGKDIALSIIKNFDYLFAIDTNTKEYNNETYHVSTLVKIFFKNEDTDIIKINFGYRNDCWSEFIPKAENHSWVFYSEFIFENFPECKNSKIGLIIDSDLGNIKFYNDRVKPVFEDHYLSDNFTLIYAGADGGKDNFANKALSYADKKANDFFEKHIKQNN